MAFKVWPKSFLILEAEDGTVMQWLYRGIYEIGGKKDGSFEIECHINKKRTVVELSDYYIDQVVELFEEVKICPNCEQYMQKNYEFCFWCEEWCSDGVTYEPKDKDRTRSRRRYNKRINLNRRLSLYENKKSIDRVSQYLQGGSVHRLDKWKVKCDCDYCEMGHRHSNLKRIDRMNVAMNEYIAE